MEQKNFIERMHKILKKVNKEYTVIPTIMQQTFDNLISKRVSQELIECGNPGVPTLFIDKDIEENFPLPGKYKFRFKFEFMNKNVWIDFNNPNTVLPLFEGKIIMKVTRINWGEESKPSNPPQSSSVFPENFTI